jgi:hypothetical protein
VTFTYTYNNANRLKTVSQSGNLLGTYIYSKRQGNNRAQAAHGAFAERDFAAVAFGDVACDCQAKP